MLVRRTGFLQSRTTPKLVPSKWTVLFIPPSVLSSGIVTKNKFTYKFLETSHDIPVFHKETKYRNAEPVIGLCVITVMNLVRKLVRDVCDLRVHEL